MKTVVCIAKKKFFYSSKKINRGQTDFFPGDTVFIFLPEFERLRLKGFVEPLEKNFEAEIEKSFGYNDFFPKKPDNSNQIWVVGDGPSGPSYSKYKDSGAVTFGVNHCFFPKLDLTPDYYLALDDGMLRKETRKIKELKATRKFTKLGNSILNEIDWPELRTFILLGETGFSIDLGEVYHGKTSAFCAIQLAFQLREGLEDKEEIEIHLAGIDLCNLRTKGVVISHHYGAGNYNEAMYPRMLGNIRFGLNFLNEVGCKWVNHSYLLASRIQDLEGGYGRTEY